MKGTAIAILFVLAALCVPQAALCESDGGISIEITSMAASSTEQARPGADADVEVDPRLSGLRRKLKSLFAYTQYAFLGRTRAHAKAGEVCSTRLPEHFFLEVEPQVPREGEDLIEMTVALVRDVPVRRPGPGRETTEREIVLRTRIRLENGGTVLLGGPPIGGGVLILALSAKR
jgi:hypothetical protein